MATKKHRCFNSTKASETIKVGNVNDFPISEEAKQFINAIKKGIDKSSLYFLNEAFAQQIGAKQIITRHYIVSQYVLKIKIKQALIKFYVNIAILTLYIL